MVIQMDFNFKDDKSKELFKNHEKKSKPNTNNSKEKKDEVKTSLPSINVPKDTREALKDFKEIDNFSLKLYKFAMFNDKSEAKIKDQKISETFFHKNWTLYENKIKAYYENIQNLNLKFSNLEPFTTSYRLVIGGEATVYETSMRLHHIYGIPYIPASGIKGVVRSYIITEKFEEQLKKYDKYSDFEEKVLFVKDEKGEYKEKGFVDVFGSQEQEGKVTFFDAFPTAKPTLKVDIMNPHYGHYYSKKIAPTDTMKLNPIPFLTVENTKFGFLIGAKEELETFSIKGKKIEDWLSEALKNHGLGAKTAVGYGYF